MKRFRRGEI